MLRVGITGAIGSGKSFISQSLRARGFRVYDADSQAKRLVEEDERLRAGIIGLLGPQAFRPDGTYDRGWVASRVFAHADLLHGLNALIHPVVLRDFQEEAHRHEEAEFVFMESALLPQIRWAGVLDRVLVVTAPREVRLARILTRDHMSRAEAESRMSAQVEAEEYLAIAHVTIRNDGVGDLEERIENALTQLRAE